MGTSRDGIYKFGLRNLYNTYKDLPIGDFDCRLYIHYIPLINGISTHQ